MFFSSDNAPRLPEAERILGELGLERLWFSDEVALCYESADDKVMIRQIAGRNAKLRVSSRRLIRLWQLALRLTRALQINLLPRPSKPPDR